MKKTKVLLFIIFICIVSAFILLDLNEYLNLEYLKANKASFEHYYQLNKYITIISYFVLYVVVTTLSLPGATILTLFGGAIFGIWQGVVIVSFASSLGASFSFLSSRYLLRDVLETKFFKQLESINLGLERDGDLYLISMRLMPVIPFFIINIVMGLTKFNFIRYYCISQLAMLPATIVYVNAGVQVGKINNLSDILSLEIFLSLLIIGILPWAGRFMIKLIKNNLGK